MTVSGEQQKTGSKTHDQTNSFLPTANCLSVYCFFRRGAAAEESTADRISIGNRAATETVEAIRLALRELGYIEGQNIAIEYRYAEGKVDRYPVLAAELVRLKVDIIVVAGGAY